jgi:hypothetical protein
MRHAILFLFLCLSFTAFSQIDTRNQMGFSSGIDTASAILMLPDRNDSDNEIYEEGESEENGSYGAFAIYYKYKPLPKWDFNACWNNL